MVGHWATATHQASCMTTSRGEESNEENATWWLQVIDATKPNDERPAGMTPPV